MASLKCIWMDCGYVEYKLCDRDYDCENCPFNQAIKKERENFSENNLKSDLTFRLIKITPNHIWYYQEENLFTFGLDGFVQKFFDGGCSIHLPTVGTILSTGKTFLWIIGSFGAIGLHLPIDGIVTWCNENVRENPSIFFKEDAMKLELVKIESNSSTVKGNIYDLSNYNELIIRDNMIIKEYVLNKYSQKTGEKITLPDGGELIKDCLRILTNQEYIHLLKLLFNKKL